MTTLSHIAYKYYVINSMLQYVSGTVDMIQITNLPSHLTSNTSYSVYVYHVYFGRFHQIIFVQKCLNSLNVNLLVATTLFNLLLISHFV